MNPFFTSLFTTNEDILSIPLTIDGFSLKLEAGGVDLSSDSVYWFKPYRSADFPEVTTSKDWFFIWSTDHDQPNGSAPGGIWWGEADDLALTNFTELGLIRQGNQAETPFLYRIPTERSGLTSDVIFLYFHTDSSDPQNPGSLQQTRLITTTGGALHTATWNDRGIPVDTSSIPNIGLYHTGYFQIINDTGTEFLAAHQLYDGSVLPADLWGYSTSADGLTFTFREAEENESGSPSGYTSYNPMNSYFDLNGQKYALQMLRLESGSSIGFTDKRMAFATANNDFTLNSFIQFIEDDLVSNVSYHVDGDTAHVYAIRGDKVTIGQDEVWYGTITLY